MVGIGIRLAQDVGAHRRKTGRDSLTVEGELWKRAFWYISLSLTTFSLFIRRFRVLVCMDRSISAALGRPCAIQDEECV